MTTENKYEQHAAALLPDMPLAVLGYWAEQARDMLLEAAKLGRNAGLEEAKQELLGTTSTHPMVLRGLKHGAEIIESLKDNTP